MIRAASAVLQLDGPHLLAVAHRARWAIHQAAEDVDFGFVAFGQHAELGAQIDDVEAVGGDFEAAGSFGHDGGNAACVQFRQVGRLHVELRRPFEHHLRAVDERDFHQARRRDRAAGRQRASRRSRRLRSEPFQRQLRVAVILATGSERSTPSTARRYLVSVAARCASPDR